MAMRSKSSRIYEGCGEEKPYRMRMRGYTRGVDSSTVGIFMARLRREAPDRIGSVLGNEPRDPK
jgi:hypothetical protein